MEKTQRRDKALVVLKAKKPEVTGQLLSDILLMIEQSRFVHALSAQLSWTHLREV
jgi:hypothetical protein